MALRLNKDVPALLKALKRSYPAANCALTHDSPFQLIVATILSAQCTDQRVNMVTPALFRAYPTPAAMAAARPSDLETIIRSTGFFRSKARSIRGTAKIIRDEHGGRVPDRMEELLALPGVARKTANVVLGTAYGKAEGVVVDTHVRRLSQRLGLSRSDQPEKIERDLMAVVPRKDWIWLSHALIQHGRAVCKARAPQCHACPVRAVCANRVY